MIAASIESPLSKGAPGISPFNVVKCGSQPASWAAYGRFIFFSISNRCSHNIQSIGLSLRFSRRTFLKQSLSIGFAFRDRSPQDRSLWEAAEQALRIISAREPLDHLNVFIEGELPSSTPDQPETRTILGGAYIAQAVSHDAAEVLELAPTFDQFLMQLGRHLRRDVRRRRANALKAGLRFEISRNPYAIKRTECYQLGRICRPSSFSRRSIDRWDLHAQSQPGFFHCALRSPTGKLLSYIAAFTEGDSVVMMYQLNDKNFPDLALNMALRGFLIERCIEFGLRRIIFPMGIAGHLRHAATVSPVTEVVFVRRSLSSVVKAIVLGWRRPQTLRGRLVKTREFFTWALTGKPAGMAL
jgi:hypothetical protein